MRNKNMIFTSMIAIFLVLVVVGGCSTQIPVSNNNNPSGTYGPGTYKEVSFDATKDIQTKTFKTQAELEKFMQSSQSSGSYSFGGGAMMTKSSVAPTASREMMTADLAVGSSEDSGTISAGPTDFSQTNNQVASVDEADTTKTDGNYIYTISNNVLFIVKAYPGEDSKVVAKIKFDNMNPQSLFVQGDHLAVFGNFYDNDYFKKIDYFPRSGMTFFNVYDISDKENPKLKKELKFDGNYFNGRMMGDYVYLLTNTYSYYRGNPIPMMFDGTVKSAMPIDQIYYFDIPYSNPTFINIHSIDLNDLSQDVNSKSVAVEGGENMYMSENNIYLTYTEYINEWDIQRKITMDLLEPQLTDSDKQLIEKIKQTDDDVLTKYEKDNKIYQVMSDYAQTMTSDEQQKFQDDVDEKLTAEMKKYKYLEYTVINKINLNGKDFEPVANGKVPGHIINQFSMDEKDNVLRIATTVSQRWDRFAVMKEGTVTTSEMMVDSAVDSSASAKMIASDIAIMPRPIGTSQSINNVYTLDADLKDMDSLEGLAEGEQIFSTRFIADRLYMVTFRQVDPFFVIDLSDPAHIETLGKLKIPGFSRYLHPYDENTIIGIGQDASATGRQEGLKISLFDVSDVEKPKEIAKYVTESDYASSTALWEHKAFLFSKDKDLLVIPVYNYDYTNPAQNYNGAFVFKITKDEIELRGLIDHSQGSNNQYWSPMVERSLFINDLLYTKSIGLLRINKLDDLSKVKNVELDSSDVPIKIY